MKLKAYKFDKNLTDVHVSLKIDGVQAVSNNGKWESRAGKPLHNLPEMPDGIYEAYLGDWAKSVSAVRTTEGSPIDAGNLYMLFPEVDKRLMPKKFLDLSSVQIRELMDIALGRGYEGLCIRSQQGHFKVKDKSTYDVKVIGVTAGKGKHAGKIGALITEQGNVGTGLTDTIRQELTDNSPIGKTIEVEVMELTPAGKFRHPRFVRLRPDKD